jgi:hypothetical protein
MVDSPQIDFATQELPVSWLILPSLQALWSRAQGAPGPRKGQKSTSNETVSSRTYFLPEFADNRHNERSSYASQIIAVKSKP